MSNFFLGALNCAVITHCRPRIDEPNILVLQFLIPEKYQNDTVVTSKVPSALKKVRIEFANALYVKNGFGSFLTQLIRGNNYFIELTHFFIDSEVILQPYTNKPELNLHYMLKGELTCELTGLGKIALIEGLSHLFYLPPGVKHKAWFYPGKYISFHISFAPAYLKNLASVNASLKELWHKAKHGLQNGKRHHPSPIHPRIKVMIQEIIDYREVKAERELYLQARIRDLLLTYIKDIENSARTQLLNRDMRRVHVIRDYILGNLNKPLNIAILAKKFELSETTLKRWFRQYYQKTIGAYLIEQRMEKAMDILINTNVPISQIGNLVGYNESSNFTRAFTNYFNYPPSYFRKS